MPINYQSIGTKKKHEFHVIDFNEENNDVTSSVNLEEQSIQFFNPLAAAKPTTTILLHMLSPL